VIVAVVATLAVVAPGAAMMTRGTLPLATVAHDAGRIVHATVSEVHSGTDESGRRHVGDVRRRADAQGSARRAGNDQAVRAFRRRARRIPGMPTYAPGEEIVVFLRAESRRGFHEPVGLEDGVYRVKRTRAGAPPQRQRRYAPRRRARFSARSSSSSGRQCAERRRAATHRSLRRASLVIV